MKIQNSFKKSFKKNRVVLIHLTKRVNYVMSDNPTYNCVVFEFHVLI